MVLHRNDLGAISVIALLLAGCSVSVEPADPSAIVPLSHLSLRTDSGLELLQGEINLVPGDSLLLRATVVGSPGDYGVPTITASDPAVLESRPDGTAAVRRAGELNLSLIALPKIASPRTPVLSANTRLRLLCTMEMRPGLSLALQDSVSGQSLSGTGSMKLRVTSPAFTDSLVAPTLIAGWSTAWERSGTYSLTADVDGYQPWRRDAVVVSSGLCHVITQRVVAKLQRK